MSKTTTQTHTVTIENTSHDGRGIAHIDGKVVFVTGAIQGERVEIQITRKFSQYLEATTVQVLDPSSNRVPPPCPHFGLCGGCSLQHVDPAQQVSMKQVALLEQFERTAKIQPDQIVAPLRGPNVGYRHKARLGVKYVAKKQKVLVGFREQNHRYLADLSQCWVLHPTVGKKITSLNQLVSGLSIFQEIPQIEVALGDEHAALVFRHLKPFSEDDIAELQNFGQTENFHIYCQPKGPDSIHKIWPQDHDDRLRYQLQGLTLAFHPSDFTQVNPEINRQMVAQALEWLALNHQDQVLDLFCGLGNFSLPMAKLASSVTGVEGSQQMVERAYENAAANHIKNAEFFAADLSQSLDDKPWAKKDYNKVLLDPPRSGALEVLTHLSRWQPERIVYVSCNPATLARDTAEIIAMGYHCSKAGILDMFPHTSHVESMALFVRK